MNYLDFREKIQKIKDNNQTIMIENLGYEIKIKDVNLVSNVLYNLIHSKEEKRKETNIFNGVKKAYDVVQDLYKHPRVLMYGLNACDSVKEYMDFEIPKRAYIDNDFIVENNKVHFSINKKDYDKLYALTSNSNLTTIVLTGKTDYIISGKKCIEINNKNVVLPLIIDMSNKMGLLFSDFLSALAIYNMEVTNETKDYLINNFDSKLLKYIVDKYLEFNLDYTEFNEELESLFLMIDSIEEKDVEKVSDFLISKEEY